MRTVVEKLKHGRPPRKNRAKVYGTRIWEEEIFSYNSISRCEFEERIRTTDRDYSYLPTKWLKGDNCVSEISADKVEKVFPNSIKLYHLL